MNRGPLQWLVRNFRTLFLAFGLALVVWVSSVIAADPNEERTITNVPLEVVGKASDLLIINEIPEIVSVKLFAPRSWLNRYENEPGLLRATLDLSGLEQGVFTVPVQVSAELDPTRVEQVLPNEVEVVLDRLVSESRPIRLDVTGRPALGHEAGEPELSNTTSTVTGPEGQVSQVIALEARLNIDGSDEPIETELPLRPVNEEGNLVTGVQFSPERVRVTLPITLQTGYRNLVVTVVTTGQVASGYRLTNLRPQPSNVIVSSPNPDLVNNLPGFVETEPLDLTDLQADVIVRQPLNLPPGVSVIGGEQSVLVEVSIEPIESSLSVTLSVEVVGLGSGLSAQTAPEKVDVILSGPIVELDVLDPADVRVFVEVTGLEPGIYQLEPQVEILSENIIVQSILPESLEVTIVEGDLPTSTPESTTILNDAGTPITSETLTATPTP